MAGSARSIQMSFFSGLRVASTQYYPAHNKNGQNISQRLVINAFMNIASRANNGEGRNDVISLTAWGKLADVCAKSMSPGKEFNCLAELHVYAGRVFQPGAPGQPGTLVTMPDGTPLTTKKMSFTIARLTFGEESNKHIADEIQAGIRPIDWNQIGSAGYTAWREKLRARSAIQFDPNLPQFGYAKVVPVVGPGITAYNPALNTGGAAPTVEGAVVSAAGNPGAVNANLFPTGQATPAPQNTGFTTPAGV